MKSVRRAGIVGRMPATKTPLCTRRSPDPRWSAPLMWGMILLIVPMFYHDAIVCDVLPPQAIWRWLALVMVLHVSSNPPKVP